jgi:hypothetical protein
MTTVKWLIVTAIFVFATFILAAQQGHAYITNTWFFNNKTILLIISSLGIVYSGYKLVKSASK